MLKYICKVNRRVKIPLQISLLKTDNINRGMRHRVSVFVCSEIEYFGGVVLSNKLLKLDVIINTSGLKNTHRCFSYEEEIFKGWDLSRLYLYYKNYKKGKSFEETVKKCLELLNKYKPYSLDDNKDMFCMNSLVYEILECCYETENRLVVLECAEGIKDAINFDVNSVAMSKGVSRLKIDFSKVTEESFHKLLKAVTPLLEKEMAIRKYHRLTDKLLGSMVESLSKGMLATEYEVNGEKVVLGMFSSFYLPDIDVEVPLTVSSFYVLVGKGCYLTPSTLGTLVSRYLNARLNSSVSCLDMRDVVIGVRDGSKNYRIKYNDKKCIFESAGMTSDVSVETLQKLRNTDTLVLSTNRSTVELISPKERVLSLKELEEEYGVTFYRDSGTFEIYPVHSSDFDEDGKYLEPYLDMNKLQKVENCWEFCMNIQRL